MVKKYSMRKRRNMRRTRRKFNFRGGAYPPLLNASILPGCKGGFFGGLNDDCKVVNTIIQGLGKLNEAEKKIAQITDPAKRADPLNKLYYSRAILQNAFAEYISQSNTTLTPLGQATIVMPVYTQNNSVGRPLPGMGGPGQSNFGSAPSGQGPFGSSSGSSFGSSSGSSFGSPSSNLSSTGSSSSGLPSNLSSSSGSYGGPPSGPPFGGGKKK